MSNISIATTRKWLSIIKDFSKMPPAHFLAAVSVVGGFIDKSFSDMDEYTSAKKEVLEIMSDELENV